MNELTVGELIDFLLQVQDKNKPVVVTNDNGDESSLYIDGEGPYKVVLGQFYED